jgi:hypothetical protein
LTGKNSAYQLDTSKPGTPDSATVGMSFTKGERVACLEQFAAQMHPGAGPASSAWVKG